MPVFTDVHPAVSAQRGIHIYQGPISQNCLRVNVLLEEKNLAFTDHVVNLFKGEQFSKDFLAINPAGLVPAMVHNGVAVSESSDIMFYLEDQHPETSFTPVNTKQKEKVHKWVDRIAKMHIGVLKELLYINGMGRPASTEHKKIYATVNPDLADFHKKYGNGFSPTQKQAVLKDVDTFLRDLEKSLTKHPYVDSNQYTIADMAAHSVIIYLKLNGYPMKQYSHINQWYKVIQRRPAVKRSVKKAKLNLPFGLVRGLFKAIQKLNRKKMI